MARQNYGLRKGRRFGACNQRKLLISSVFEVCPRETGMIQGRCGPGFALESRQ